MSRPTVLIVEDEELMRGILRQLLEGAGFDVFTADSGENAIDVFSTSNIDVTLTDIKMSGIDGLTLLDRIKSLDDEAMVVMMTAYSSVDTAVAALRKGAYDYVTKPFVNEDLIQTVRNAARQRDLFRENRFLRRELGRHSGFSEMVGNSASLLRIKEMVEKVAPTSANVLIRGESGTGKELVARSIHFNSPRRDRSFLAVNCGALTESLLESELFGHVKGSFTGAITDKKGLFRAADGGTLFLDEISELSPALQVKLLRALQESQVMPVGSASPVSFDARIVAATNRDLAAEIAAGRFRDDLYYRLNVIEIEVPPLRERKDDIPLLIRHFLGKEARKLDAPMRMFTEEALATLQAYKWPGNVRELEHVIERALILSDDELGVDSLPRKLKLNVNDRVDSRDGHRSLETVERQHILTVLSELSDDKAAAAKVLGIDLSTLYRKLKRFELD